MKQDIPDDWDNDFNDGKVDPMATPNKSRVSLKTKLQDDVDVESKPVSGRGIIFLS